MNKRMMPNLGAVALALAVALATPTTRLGFVTDAFALLLPPRLVTPTSTLPSVPAFPLGLSSSSETSSPNGAGAAGSDSTTAADPSNNPTDVNDLVFVRPALLVDMNRASKILADGFFKGPQTNWITYQYEKLVTYLSLEANFPKKPHQRARYEIFVACERGSGTVVGMAEIDARGMADERTARVYEQSGGSAYMCNLAVDEQRRRMGIATALVRECESVVREWHEEDERRKRRKSDSAIELKSDIIYDTKNEIISDNIILYNRANKDGKNNKMSKSVCLKVREADQAAVQMYQKLGYATIFEEMDQSSNKSKSRGNILLMRKKL